ncbi:hypothetical protein AVEN_126584-1 [Araneus ventricosus]|uniref:Uncharacterized protein n=1 Tax=Araneus ventricosus TaxID=182803 RepID=A0A4Y2IA28_ARAVE|nr:hypothetical protein AVEN_126584-1 [Araneus ventricosus]
MPIRPAFEDYKGLRSSSSQGSFYVSRNNKQEVIRKCLQMYISRIVVIKGPLSNQVPECWPAARALWASSNLGILGNTVISSDNHLSIENRVLMLPGKLVSGHFLFNRFVCYILEDLLNV